MMEGSRRGSKLYSTYLRQCSDDVSTMRRVERADQIASTEVSILMISMTLEVVIC